MKWPHFTPDADSDIGDITLYFSTRSKAKGIRVIKAIQKSCHLHARFPLLGRDRKDLGTGIRTSVVGKYVVYFRKSATGIDVLHIFHGSKNVEKSLFK